LRLRWLGHAAILLSRELLSVEFSPGVAGGAALHGACNSLKLLGFGRSGNPGAGAVRSSGRQAGWRAAGPDGGAVAERVRAGRRASRSARARLPGAARPEVLVRRLEASLGAGVELNVTDNTYTMISFSRRGGAYRVRLHHMFLWLPEPL